MHVDLFLWTRLHELFKRREMGFYTQGYKLVEKHRLWTLDFTLNDNAVLLKEACQARGGNESISGCNMWFVSETRSYQVFLSKENPVVKAQSFICFIVLATDTTFNWSGSFTELFRLRCFFRTTQYCMESVWNYPRKNPDDTWTCGQKNDVSLKMRFGRISAPPLTQCFFSVWLSLLTGRSH